MTGGVPSGSSVDEHRNGCAHCNELFGNAARLGRHLADVASCVPHAGVTKQLRATESLIADERGIRAFLRSRSTRVRWALSLILPALLLVREVLQTSVPLGELGTTRVLVGLLLLGLLGVVADSALRPLPIERRAARLRSVLALVACCLPCLLWFAPDPVSAGTLSNSGFGRPALACFGYGSSLAAPSFVLLWAFDRGERVSFRVWLLGAGLVAVLSNLILLLHCSSTQLTHLMAGHFSIGLAWFAAVSFGAYRGRRLR